MDRHKGGFAELASKQIEAQIHKPITVENLGVNGLKQIVSLKSSIRRCKGKN